MYRGFPIKTKFQWTCDLDLKANRAFSDIIVVQEIVFPKHVLLESVLCTYRNFKQNDHWYS